jgi:hypothetical protein
MFEACLEEHPEAKVMMEDYRPAKIFQEDLFTELVRKTRLIFFSSEKRGVPLTGGS